MISSDTLRGYNDTIILRILLDEDSYGYRISKAIAKATQGRYVMKETTLYSAFNRLERNGYIVSYSGAETMGKPRTYYHITDEGRAYYYEKCQEWRLTKDVLGVFFIDVEGTDA
jgi:PadR family transcriptional regulator PadR